MRAEEFFESKSYTQQDVRRVLERLYFGLTVDQIEDITRQYLEKIYGTGTTRLILYQGILRDILPLYQKYIGRPKDTAKKYRLNIPKPDAEQLAKKKTELIFKAEKIAREIQNSEKWIDQANHYLEKWPVTKFSTSQDVATNYELKKTLKKSLETKTQKEKEFDTIKQEIDRLSINESQI